MHVVNILVSFELSVLDLVAGSSGQTDKRTDG